MLKLYTLLNGKEVIGKIIDETTSTITMESPMIIQLIPQTNDSYGLGLYPYSISNPSGRHEFFINTLQSESREIPKDIEESYVKETTGISIVQTLR